jgi:hypothetical protein
MIIVVTYFWVSALKIKKIYKKKYILKNIYSEGIQKNNRSDKRMLECL